MYTGFYNRLRLPVWASDVDVIRAARRKIKKRALRDPALREQRKALYRQMLTYHATARDVYRRVVSGNI